MSASNRIVNLKRKVEISLTADLEKKTKSEIREEWSTLLRQICETIEEQQKPSLDIIFSQERKIKKLKRTLWESEATVTFLKRMLGEQ